jgi:2-hydroxycyclohexanecarboxyl-CoA dehydrogenase
MAENPARVALVTGGAGGIGTAICRALASDGRRVAVADLGLEACEEVAAEIGGVGIALDVTDAASVANALGEVERQLGRIEILVNCAGWDEFKRFIDTDEAFQARVLDINLAGPIRLTRAVLPGMLEGGFGRVVNIASDAGRVGSSGEAIYSAAKGGLIAFTKTIARESARGGVTANTVCPGPVNTPLFQGMAGRGGDSERLTQALERAIPMRRLGQPDDVAPAVAFLASESAGYITGQTLSVSGGLTMA